MNDELWRDINGCSGLYQVSNMGRVKSMNHVTLRSDGKPLAIKERILRCNPDQHGYLRTMVNRKTAKVHRLVAAAFIQNPFSLPEVNHIDGNKQNNHSDNLEWVTHRENTAHALSIGKYDHHASRLSQEDVGRIRSEYVPHSKDHGTYALAKKYGMSPSYIWRVIVGQKRRKLERGDT